ncbi:PepSY-associated TM helix domain-containing protein [Thermomonas flagellata]|uniref:PepSY-associated TM helix domain-containing protein n=1 Tax=Thermomonas flagellata TaxID=2888524 RepID=UPI001F047F2D|nr:PepSY-associated TM helix domain-containing protein [Thermomonas flagellata]
MHATSLPAARPRARLHRAIRQLHLWLGAWGALAAILYGLTGLVMNHRFGEGAWPQGDSRQGARMELPVPPAARASPEQLSLWLRAQHGLEASLIRRGGPGPDSRPGSEPPAWRLSGGSARQSWVLEYEPGRTQAQLVRTTHSPLAALNRLHKAVGGGPAWILLADSFALAMVALGVSGIWMWARGRRPRDLLLSVMGLSTLVLLAVLGLALR